MAGEQALTSRVAMLGSVIDGGHADAPFLQSEAPQPPICTRMLLIVPTRNAYV
jgi:hypothetical protein